MTRCCRRSSIVTSFFTSPSSIFETGMPVHLADDLGDVFFVDLFLQHARLLAIHLRAELRDFRFELRQLAVLDLRRALVVALARGLLLLRSSAARSAPWSRGPSRWLPSPASSAPSAHSILRLMCASSFSTAETLTRVGIVFALQRLALDLELRRAALQLVDLRRHRIDLDT